MEVSASGKHTSLLRYGNNNCRKKFYGEGPGDVAAIGNPFLFVAVVVVVVVVVVLIHVVVIVVVEKDAVVGDEVVDAIVIVADGCSNGCSYCYRGSNCCSCSGN